MRISGPVGATRSPILPPKLGPQGAVPLCRPGCGGGCHPEFSPLADSRAFAARFVHELGVTDDDAVVDPCHDEHLLRPVYI